MLLQPGAKLVNTSQMPVIMRLSISPLAKLTTFSAINATSSVATGYKSFIFHTRLLCSLHFLSLFPDNMEIARGTHARGFLEGFIEGGGAGESYLLVEQLQA